MRLLAKCKGWCINDATSITQRAQSNICYLLVRVNKCGKWEIKLYVGNHGCDPVHTVLIKLHNNVTLNSFCAFSEILFMNIVMLKKFMISVVVFEYSQRSY